MPKSLGGTNSRENLVRLSPREHFICHALLCKMVDDSLSKRKMSFAFFRMKMSNSKTGYSRIGNGKLYEKLRKSIAVNVSGENNPSYGFRQLGNDNPFFGRKHSISSRQQMSLTKKGTQVGQNNPFFGRTHSAETKRKISNQQSESIVVIFTDGAEVRLSKKGDLGKHLGVCKALGIQLCTTLKRHLWNKYNIKEIRQHENS